MEPKMAEITSSGTLLYVPRPPFGGSLSRPRRRGPPGGARDAKNDQNGAKMPPKTTEMVQKWPPKVPQTRPEGPKTAEDNDVSLRSQAAPGVGSRGSVRAGSAARGSSAGGLQGGGSALPGLGPGLRGFPAGTSVFPRRPSQAQVCRPRARLRALCAFNT